MATHHREKMIAANGIEICGDAFGEPSERWHERLVQIDVPTLVVHGTDDPKSCPATTARRWLPRYPAPR